VRRGRAVFARSVNKHGCIRHCCSDYNETKEDNRRDRRRQISEALLFKDELWEADTLFEEAAEVIDKEDEMCCSWESSDDVSTAASDSSWKFAEDQLVSRWQLAMARAEEAAKSYEVAHGKEVLGAASIGRRGQRKTRAKHLTFLASLATEHNAHVSACCFFPRPTGSFDAWRQEFLMEHGKEACAGLQSCFQGPMQLRPTPLSETVKKSFFAAVGGDLSGVVRPAYHGTDSKNLNSIYSKGLLIPGAGNDLRVLHGAAHGRGIYTAKIHDARLSWGFARGAVLICGVLDDAVPKESPEMMGSFQVTQESTNIRHVGNAMVVFDPRRVAPLWEARSFGSLVLTDKRVPTQTVCSKSAQRKKCRSRLQVRSHKIRSAEAFLQRRAAQKRRFAG